MSVFKCKMCGGTIEFNPGDTVGVCDSCGTKQTLPRLDDEKRANLYDRANHFRRNNEFDKAAGIYEQILNEDGSDAEAYWSLVLCRYGIEYVEDAATKKRVPTINRAQYTSVFDDDNYKSALKYADGYQKAIYEEEAKTINDIQKGILEISQKEEPFDVFICYKENDSAGRRTPDSVLANDLYHQLTREGFKVFFARITLEDKLGTAYEPYIFAALNSAKVMVVLGTKPEYFNAVWVKNEWSRYLSLIKNGADKMLVPAYKDMDPYDLPEEFSHLQAQDMSKLGFMQDLIRGIKKIVNGGKSEKNTQIEAAAPSSGSNTEPLLKRAFIFLEDGDFKSADEYCEKVLDINPECAEAYLGKLMAELNVKKRGKLRDVEFPFDTYDNYKKIMRFGDENLKAQLKKDIEFINERTLDAILERAKSKLSSKLYEEALELLNLVFGWKDADKLIDLCNEKMEEERIEEERKVEERRLAAERKAEERRIQAEKTAKRLKKIAAVAIPALCVCIAFLIVLNTVIIPKHKLNKAMSMLDSGEYDSAYALLKEIGNSEAINSNKYDRAMQYIESCEYDSAYALLEEIGNSEAIDSSKYDRAMQYIESGEYDSAYALLEEIGNREAINSNKYDRAMQYIDSGDYESAYKLLDGLSYKDSYDKLLSIKPKYQQILIARANVGDTVFFGSYEQDNVTTNGKEDIEWNVLAKENNRVFLISKYALDCKQYNSTYTDVKWETCSIRQWLNGTFLNDAFSTEDQALIKDTYVSADVYPEYDTNPVNATTDKVFLLSDNEVNKYLCSFKDRKCVPTEYAKANGAYTSSSNTKNGVLTCVWWLRSPGPYQRVAAYVLDDGSVYYLGDYGFNVDVCVRPAMWVSIK